MIDRSALNLAIKFFLQIIVNSRYNFLKSRVIDSVKFELFTLFYEQSSNRSISSNHTIDENIKEKIAQNMTTNNSTQTKVKFENTSRSQQTKKKQINAIVIKFFDAYFKTHQSLSQTIVHERF